ncbi:hypothetical protein [Treponema ruminis]|uniref:Serine/threonine protein kinase n=1 Tax=Treponema ruminis TaxID=744515 RepID=A0A7W8G773_9SPIR|nr:hypothetical protein [Treponema ruminis]MBB5225099.1 serine/threonine protein kinase [Treponema ruminis]
MENMEKIESLFVNQNEYKIIRLLGHGKGGYSYLAEKADSSESEKVVLKQIHHEPCSYYTFGNKIESEQKDYKRLCDAGIRIPKMLDIDLENERIVKEFIDGETIFDLVKNGGMKEEYLSLARQMAERAKEAGLNIDYFPTNFVVQKNADSGEEEIFYIDYECNDYMEEWNFENWGIKYWSKTSEFLDYLSKSN